MRQTSTPIEILDNLYLMARNDVRATPARLMCRIGMSRNEIAHWLDHLESRGLVDAKACRLTLRGLSLIRAFRTRQAGKRKPHLSIVAA